MFQENLNFFIEKDQDFDLNSVEQASHVEKNNFDQGKNPSETKEFEEENKENDQNTYTIENNEKIEEKLDNLEENNEKIEEKPINLEENTTNTEPKLKKPSIKQKKTIIEDFEFLLSTHSSTPILACKTSCKLSLVPSKDFIKKNKERSSAYIKTLKSPSNKPNTSQISELLDSKKSKNLDVKERFYKKAEDYQKKKEELKEKIKKNELVGCTFQPKTNTKEKIKQNQADFNKKLEQYTEKKKKKQEEALAKSKERVEKEQKEEETFYKPKINEKSKEILSKKQNNEENIYERLYKQYKTPDSKQFNEEESPNPLIEQTPVFFSPNINKKSKDLNRTEKIEKILYNDALRRKNKPVQPLTSPCQKFMNSNSEKVLIDKFKREFNEALNESETNQSELIDYRQFSDLLSILLFVTEKQNDKSQALQL